MEVEVLRVEGVSGDAIISARAGAAPRHQARAADLGVGGLPLRLGAATGGARDGLVRLHLLQPVGAARVVLRPEAYDRTYTVPLAGGSASVTFVVHTATVTAARPGTADSDGVGIGALLQPPSTPSCPGGTPRTPPEAQAYMEEHRLLPLMRALLRTVVRERPEEPFGFLAGQFHDEVLFAAPGVAPGAEGPARGLGGHLEVEVLAVTGAPKGAVLSILAWKSRRQFPVEMIGDAGETCRFAAGPAGLNPFKLDLLKPLGGASLALEVPEAGKPTMRTVEIAGTKASVVLSLRELGSPAGKVAAAGEPDVACAWPRCLPRFEPQHLQAAVVSAKEYLDGHGILCAMQGLMEELLLEMPPDPYATIAAWFRRQAAREAAGELHVLDGFSPGTESPLAGASEVSAHEARGGAATPEASAPKAEGELGALETSGFAVCQESSIEEVHSPVQASTELLKSAAADAASNDMPNSTVWGLMDSATKDSTPHGKAQAGRLDGNPFAALAVPTEERPQVHHNVTPTIGMHSTDSTLGKDIFEPVDGSSRSTTPRLTKFAPSLPQGVSTEYTPRLTDFSPLRAAGHTARVPCDLEGRTPAPTAPELSPFVSATPGMGAMVHGMAPPGVQPGAPSTCSDVSLSASPRLSRFLPSVPQDGVEPTAEFTPRLSQFIPAACGADADAAPHLRHRVPAT